eukprot:scaffold255490_cov33-Tisochrysis_lutea.AAC.3
MFLKVASSRPDRCFDPSLSIPCVPKAPPCERRTKKGEGVGGKGDGSLKRLVPRPHSERAREKDGRAGEGGRGEKERAQSAAAVRSYRGKLRCPPRSPSVPSYLDGPRRQGCPATRHTQVGRGRGGGKELTVRERAIVLSPFTSLSLSCRLPVSSTCRSLFSLPPSNSLYLRPHRV